MQQKILVQLTADDVLNAARESVITKPQFFQLTPVQGAEGGEFTVVCGRPLSLPEIREACINYVRSQLKLAPGTYHCVLSTAPLVGGGTGRITADVTLEKTT